MKVHFVGSGDAFGSGGRFQTCILLQTSSSGPCLVDCGASSLTALKRAGIAPNDIETVLISHLHGDHFGGLPFMVLDAQFTRRTRPLVVAGPPGVSERVRQAMEVFYPGSADATRKFELRFVELSEQVPSVIGALRVRPFEVLHACGSPPYALRIEVDGKTIVYSGDTEWTDTLLHACDGADLFICEAYFFDKKVRYHLDHASLLRNADRLRCARVVLTHMGPEMLARVSETPFEVAFDGLQLTV